MSRAAQNELQRVVEALLFSSEKPLNAAQIQETFEEKISAEDIKRALEALKAEYETQDRAFRVFEIAGGYQLATDERFAPYLRRLHQAREKKRVTQASLETLSIIAYRQPVTRADIEAIRGVNVDGAVKTLLEKNLIRIVGRKEVPGRPMLYGTTKEFLEHFGLNSLDQLPPLNQFKLEDLPESMLPPELKRKEEEPSNHDAQGT